MNYRTEKVLKIGEVFPVNEELAGIVPLATPDEQAVLAEDVAKNGLIQPVILYKGCVVDGRCRQKACIVAYKPVRAIDLDDTLTEEEVKAYVKAVNTRRNLTRTQKVMVASRESLKPNSKSIVETAKSWGVSRALVENARWLIANQEKVAEDLFNGLSIQIGDKVSNKVSTIYAHFKAKTENITEDTQHGWDETSYIKTQAGKNWYYDQVKSLDKADVQVKMLVAELANYKFGTNS